MSHPYYIKLVVVGDPGVGKTCLLSTYANDRFPSGYIPTVFDSRASEVEIDGHECILAPWDTAGLYIYREKK